MPRRFKSSSPRIQAHGVTAARRALTPKIMVQIHLGPPVMRRQAMTGSIPVRRTSKREEYQEVSYPLVLKQ